jgi:hypothetical protein
MECYAVTRLMDVVIGSLLGVILGFGLGWARDWWSSRPRIDVRIGLVRTVYASFVAMMMKYAWMQCDEASAELGTALLVVLNVAVLNESGEDAISEAKLIVPGAESSEHPQPMREFAAKVKGESLLVPAMVANERKFLGQNLSAHSLTDARLVFEIYRRDLKEAAWGRLLDSKPQLSIATIRGAKAKAVVDLRRTDVVKSPPVPKDLPGPHIYFTPPIHGYERFQTRHEVFGDSYESTYFGERYIYREEELW